MGKLRTVYFTDLFTGAVKSMLLLQKENKEQYCQLCRSLLIIFSLTSAYAYCRVWRRLFYITLSFPDKTVLVAQLCPALCNPNTTVQTGRYKGIKSSRLV